MSLSTIKSDLENHLKLNLTNVAIKFNNTNYYMKNNAPLGQAEIDALTFFVEPKVIPISDDRELMSSDTPFATICFFQIDIYNKVGTGTGLVHSTIETLNITYREQYVNSTLIYKTNTIGSFVEGEFEITPHRLFCELRN